MAASQNVLHIWLNLIEWNMEIPDRCGTVLVWRGTDHQAGSFSDSEVLGRGSRRSGAALVSLSMVTWWQNRNVAIFGMRAARLDIVCDHHGALQDVNGCEQEQPENIIKQWHQKNFGSYKTH